jgi:hypothetical protein
MKDRERVAEILQGRVAMLERLLVESPKSLVIADAHGVCLHGGGVLAPLGTAGNFVMMPPHQRLRADTGLDALRRGNPRSARVQELTVREVEEVAARSLLLAREILAAVEEGGPHVQA